MTLPKQLALLTLGAFALGTDVFVIAGLLPDIAEDLSVSPAGAGQLVTVFALVYAVGSPLLAVATGAIGRKRLLAVVLAGFALTNVLAAICGSYALLFIARVVAACFAALFMPNASALAAVLAPPEQRGRALAAVTGGLTLATVFGVPLGTLVGSQLGWRATFVLVAALALVAAVGVGWLLPAIAQQPPTVGLRGRLDVARRPRVLLTLALIMTWFSGGFLVYTYIRPVAREIADIGGAGLSGVLLAFGVAAVAGNALGGIGADRWSPRRTLIAGVGGLAVALAALGLLATAKPVHLVGLVGLVAAMVLWGLTGWAVNPPQQSILLANAPDAPPVVLGLGGSANYAGIALGGALGGLIVRWSDPAVLGLVAAGIEVVAVALLVVLRRSFEQPPRVVVAEQNQQAAGRRV